MQNIAPRTRRRRLSDPGVEAHVMSVVNAASPRGVNMREIAAGKSFSHPQLWSAVRRLEHRGMLWRFALGEATERDSKSAASDTTFIVLHEHRRAAYVEQETQFDESMAALYAALGMRVPATIQRSPPFRPLGDDDAPKRNRYAEEIAEREA